MFCSIGLTLLQIPRFSWPFVCLACLSRLLHSPSSGIMICYILSTTSWSIVIIPYYRSLSLITAQPFLLLVFFACLSGRLVIVLSGSWDALGQSPPPPPRPLWRPLGGGAAVLVHRRHATRSGSAASLWLGHARCTVVSMLASGVGDIYRSACGFSLPLTMRAWSLQVFPRRRLYWRLFSRGGSALGALHTLDSVHYYGSSPPLPAPGIFTHHMSPSLLFSNLIGTCSYSLIYPDIFFDTFWLIYVFVFFPSHLT